MDDKILADTAKEIEINKEVEWGRSYRYQKKNARKASLVPTPSPLNIQKLWQQYQLSKQLEEINELKRKLAVKPLPRMPKLPKGRINPDTMSKKKYYDYLSTPHKYHEPPPLPDPLKKPHKEECSPRLMYLAVPTKNRVLSTWKDYQHMLPMDFIVRLEELLHTDHNLDPKFARCYFKTLDRRKKKQHCQMRRKYRRQKRKKKKQCKEWLRFQVKTTSKLLVKFLRREPLFTLNFKQMKLSDAILNQLKSRGDIRRKPARNTNKPYGRAVIDIIDQLSVWIDTIVRYVDVQYTESVEEIVEVSSMESLLGEEEEEEEELPEAPPKRYSHPPLPPLPDMPPLPDVPDIMPLIREEAEDQTTYGTTTALEAALGEAVVGEDGTFDELSLALSEDTLELLISILSVSTPEMLEQLVNPDVLPGITYQDILDRLRNLRDKALAEAKEQRHQVLQEAMLAWAQSNEPDKVNERVMNKIQDAAAILSQCLTKEAADRGEPLKQTVWESGEESTYTPATTAMGPTTEEGTTEEPGTDEELAAEELRTLDTLPEEEGERTATIVPEEVSDAVGTASDLDQGEEEISELYHQEGEATERASWTVKPDDSTSQPAVAPPEVASADDELNVIMTEDQSEILSIEVSKEEPSLKPAVAGTSKSSIPGMIPGHKPSRVFEHQPDTICCLTLKVWATWLLEVAHNAHTWSRWLNDIINEVRRIAGIIRGEIKDESGNPIKFYKEDWTAFGQKVDDMITSWRQYSMHVKDLTDKIVHNFRGKTVTCCPKCLEDNLIVDVGLAHNISQQLAEAMNTAGYWRRWLDSVVMETKRLTGAAMDDNESQASSYGTMEIIEIHEAHPVDSEESIYEIEELDPDNN